MYPLLTILGPTATGKTTLACHLAALLNGEVISADSRQVYRGMDLGTGKDLDDFLVGGLQIPYHLMDVADPGDEFNVHAYQMKACDAIVDISQRNKLPILCGGSGMYLDAVLRGYELNTAPPDELLRRELEVLSEDALIRRLRSYGALHNTTDITDRSRLIRAIEIAAHRMAHPEIPGKLPLLKSLNFGINFEREVLRKRITQRLKQRLDRGMVDEVRSLLNNGVTPDQLKFYGLEYRYLTQYVMGEISREEMFRQLNTAIHQFAKRQMTWFRRMEKHGVHIHWLPGEISLDEKVTAVINLMPRG